MVNEELVNRNSAASANADRHLKGLRAKGTYV